jgi:hypothetical protein
MANSAMNASKPIISSRSNARAKIESWRIAYNTERPHSSRLSHSRGVR